MNLPDPVRVSEALRKLSDRVRLCAQIVGGDIVPGTIPPEPNPEPTVELLAIAAEFDALSNVALTGEMPAEAAVEELLERAQSLNCAISFEEAEAVLMQVREQK